VDAKREYYVKIKQKLATGALFWVALFPVVAPLLSAYIMLHPASAGADPSTPTSTSAAIVPDNYDISNKSTKNNSNYLCTAAIHKPTVLGDQQPPAPDGFSLTTTGNNLGYSDSFSYTPVKSLLGAVQGVDSNYTSVFNDVTANKGMIFIDFSGVNPGTDNQPLCQESMALFRQPGASDSTTFYGFWDTGELVTPGTFSSDKFKVVAIKATVNVTAKTIDFTMPAGYSRTGNFLLKLNDPDNIMVAGGTYFPTTGGGGSATAGANCFESNASTNADLQACINKTPAAIFTDAANIDYAGDIYTASGWGNVANQIVYTLSKPADSSRIKGGTLPKIVMTTNDGVHITDINMDDKGSYSDIQDIYRAFTESQASGASINLELDNVDIGGNGTTGTIKANPAGIKNFATYYAKDDVVTLVFAQAGNNEQPYFGTYTRQTGTQTFNLPGSNWSGKCGNLANFDFGGIDPAHPPQAYQGSTLSAATTVPAVWNLNASPSGTNCTVGNISVNVAINTTDNAPDSAATTKGTGDAPEINCAVSLFNPLSWFLCPLATALEAVVSGLDDEINNFMDIKAGKGSYDVRNTSDCPDQWCYYYKPWSVTRDISLSLTVVFALIAIVSQAFGFEIFDAYTLRKVLPRLLLAIIGISLSWPLMMFFINLTDALGIGIRGLIYAPFASINKVALGGGGQFIAGLFGAGAITALGFAGLLSFVATAALAVAVAFLVLTLRQMIITMLVIFAPVAILFYTLPNTQKLWKIWWDSFSRGLLMFPLIAAFIAIGRVFAAVNSKNAGSINQIISFTAYFAPYFLIPFTFRLAGGAIATLGGMVNDRSRGAFDRLRGYRANKTQQNLHDLANGNRIKADNWAANAFNDTARNIANLPSAGFNPAKMRSRMRAAASAHGLGELGEYMEKNSAFNAIKGNDDYLQATMESEGGGHHEDDWRRYLQAHGYTGEGLEQSVQAIRAAKRGVSNEIFERAVVVANASTGTGWKEGSSAAMMADINRVTGNDRQTATAMLAQMRGAAAQSGRQDLVGSGFGTQASVMNRMLNDGMSAEDANDEIHQGTIFTKNGGDWTRQRGTSAQNMAPAIVRRIKRGHAAVADAKRRGDVAGEAQASRELAQDYANLTNLHESLNHSSPENARILADSVLTKEGADGVRIMDQMLALQRGENIPAAMLNAYHEVRKEYSGNPADAAERSRPPEPPES